MAQPAAYEGLPYHNESLRVASGGAGQTQRRLQRAHAEVAMGEPNCGRRAHLAGGAVLGVLLLAAASVVASRARSATMAAASQGAMTWLVGDAEDCSSYEKADCPDDRCTWNGGKCVVQCSELATLEACWQQGHCMFDGGKCLDACWLIDNETRCKALPRCMYHSAECKVACHVHDTEPWCLGKDQCMWLGGKCLADPCSAPGENCNRTQCCSNARGGEGMTCFKQDKDQASCLIAIDTAGAQQGWSGEAIGNRTKRDPGCTWAGDDCSSTHVCCNEGFNCIQKDSEFSGCVQAYETKAWGEVFFPVPPGWQGTKLGGWRSEYEIQPAAQGATMAGTSFYCFMAVLPGSTEMQLLQVAYDNNASIFGCDASKVFKSSGVAGGAANNAAIFFDVLNLVQEEGVYLQHDWTIKVDVDTVFLPERMRQHLWALRPPADTALYLKNNGLTANSNHGFLGAIEVFSKRAMELYFDNDDNCAKYIGTGYGEDGYTKTCMDALGAGFMWDKNIFQPSSNPAICTNSAYTGYHPMKYPSHWKRCLDIATGKMCQGLSYDCGGALDPPFSQPPPEAAQDADAAWPDDYMEEDE